ncbi:MAG: HypC/HybG/HupF family hydrogenase formation chaperone, partial [Oscillospiraceae bacterium]
MCVAAPGIVKKINGSKVLVDFNGNIVECEAGLVSVEVGQSVLVHAGCVIQ